MGNSKSDTSKVARQNAERSIAALVQMMGCDDPEDAIRLWARKTMSRARQRGFSGPPFDLEALADLLGIRVKTDETGTVRDAMLIAEPNGRLMIICTPNCSMGRRNYNIGHELAHTAFPDRFTQPKFRNGTEHADAAIEHLCDIGASELLMPYPEFERDLRASGFALTSGISLARAYRASREATIRRMVHSSVASCAAVFVSLRNKPRDVKAAPLKLRVDSFTRSDQFPTVYIPKHKSVPDNCCAYELMSHVDDHNVAGGFIEMWNIRGLQPCRVEAIRIASAEETRLRAAIMLSV